MSQLIEAPVTQRFENPCASGDVSPRCLRERLSRQLVISKLRYLEQGEVTLIEGESEQVFGKMTSTCPLHVTLTVHHPQFYPRVAFGGDIGAAESFMDGDWSCDSLTDFVRLLIVNSQTEIARRSWISWLFEPLYQIGHWLNRNTKRGSQKNIAAHYDLGNDFFELFLDETRMYSCGLFLRPDSSLFEASTAKNERICQKLNLKPSDHLLEIGTGWGGFAIHAAKKYGCRITTTTISHKQFEFTKKRVSDAGLSERVTVLMQDYRDLRGQFDKLVSIEMIEAVGHEFFDSYFKSCSRLLKPDGLFVLQGITISDQLYQGYIRRVDFIQRYIFPGGCLPSITQICDVLTRSSDLRLSHLEDFASHYAQTLRHWRARFLAQLDRVKRLGFDDRFIRMWDYYLCYCEGAFVERNCSLVQIVLTKPRCRDEFVFD
jgi:cyclopropane-fatty-acyl-phospholipid synthase